MDPLCVRRRFRSVGCLLWLLWPGIQTLSIRHLPERGQDSFWRHLHSFSGFSVGLVCLLRIFLLYAVMIWCTLGVQLYLSLRVFLLKILYLYLYYYIYRTSLHEKHFGEWSFLNKYYYYYYYYYYIMGGWAGSIR